MTRDLGRSVHEPQYECGTNFADNSFNLPAFRIECLAVSVAADSAGFCGNEGQPSLHGVQLGHEIGHREADSLQSRHPLRNEAGCFLAMRPEFVHLGCTKGTVRYERGLSRAGSGRQEN